MSYELITTVYLNEGAHQFHGFGVLAPAKLSAAAGFTLTVFGQPSTEQVKACLETRLRAAQHRRPRPAMGPQVPARRSPQPQRR